MPPQKGGFCELLGAVTVEEDAACSLTKTLLRKRVSTTMTVDNVTILGWQKYLVNLLPSCTCDCSLLISVGCKTKPKPKPKSRSKVKSRFLQNKSNILEQQAHLYILQQLGSQNDFFFRSFRFLQLCSSIESS